MDNCNWQSAVGNRQPGVKSNTRQVAVCKQQVYLLERGALSPSLFVRNKSILKPHLRDDGEQSSRLAALDLCRLSLCWCVCERVANKLDVDLRTTNKVTGNLFGCLLSISL